MATDKTGAPTTVTLENDRFTIALDGQAVGEAVFTERGLQRIFLHTEVAADFEGRGLATILVGEVLDKTKAYGLRIVVVCPLVKAYLRSTRNTPTSSSRAPTSLCTG
jgi:uncharacterized protein